MLDRIMSFNWLLSCPFEEFTDESKRIGLFLVFCAKDKLQMHKSDKIIDNIFFFIFSTLLQNSKFNRMGTDIYFSIYEL